MNYLTEGFTQDDLANIGKRKGGGNIAIRPSFVNEMPPQHGGAAGFSEEEQKAIAERRMPQPVNFQDITVKADYSSSPMAAAMEEAFRNVIGMTIPKGMKL